MTCTDLLVAGVIAALFVPDAREYETKAAFGVVIVCVAFATTAEVMTAMTVASSIAAYREDFWTRIIMVFIWGGFLSGRFVPVGLPGVYKKSRRFGKTKTRTRTRQIPVPKTQSPSHLPAQRNAFHRHDVRQR